MLLRLLKRRTFGRLCLGKNVARNNSRAARNAFSPWKNDNACLPCLSMEEKPEWWQGRIIKSPIKYLLSIKKCSQPLLSRGTTCSVFVYASYFTFKFNNFSSPCLYFSTVVVQFHY